MEDIDIAQFARRGRVRRSPRSQRRTGRLVRLGLVALGLSIGGMAILLFSLAQL